MSTTENQKEKHHYLIAGQVMLTHGDDEALNAVFLNAVITTEEFVIGAHDIGRAQQSLQMLFFKKVPPEDQSLIKIVDVVVMSITYLGYMTDERFLKKPNDVELKERAKVVLRIVASNDSIPDPEAKILDPQ